MPHAFTEHEVLMLANVLNSERAVRVSVQVVRAFIRLRETLAAHADLAQKLAEMEKKYDTQFKAVFEAIHRLMARPEPSGKRIGFLVDPSQKSFLLTCLSHFYIFRGDEAYCFQAHLSHPSL